MASSEEPNRPNKGRRVVFVILLLVILAGLYSAGWLYAARRVQEQALAALARLSDQGVTAVCADPGLHGFPFRIGLTCRQTRVEDGPHEASVATGELRAAAPVWSPFRIESTIAAPGTVEAPAVGSLRLDWESLASTVRLARPLPQSIALRVRNGTVEAGAGRLGSVEAGSAQVAARGPDLVLNAVVTGLNIAPQLVEGRVLPPLDGSASVVLKDGALQAAEGRQSLRGSSGEILDLTVSTGISAQIALTGPFSIGEDGLIDAELTLAVTDPSAVAAALAEIFPEERQNIQTAFSGLALMGKNAKLPLTIERGAARLAFFKLGTLPPVL